MERWLSTRSTSHAACRCATGRRSSSPWSRTHRAWTCSWKCPVATAQGRSEPTSGGSTSFVRDYTLLYKFYDYLACHYPGWSIGDIKRLTYRERVWWVNMVQWRSQARV